MGDDDEDGDDDFIGSGEREISYADVGRMLVHLIVDPKVGRVNYRYEVEVLDYDGCVALIAEGVGIDFWMDGHIDLELSGFYVIEGITGYYHRGDGWTTDDDEEWEFTLVRRADEQEILFSCLKEVQAND